MEKLDESPRPNATPSIPAIPSVERRMFLRQVGLVSATTAAFLASCTQEMAIDPNTGKRQARVGAEVLPDGTIDLERVGELYFEVKSNSLQHQLNVS